MFLKTAGIIVGADSGRGLWAVMVRIPFQADNLVSTDQVLKCPMIFKTIGYQPLICLTML